MRELKKDPGNAVLVVEYREDLKIKNYSKQTIDCYFRNAVAFLIWVEKTLDKPVKEITRQDVINYNLCTKQKGASDNTVHRYMQSVKRFFDWLEQSDYILVSPCYNMIIPRIPPRIPVVLTVKEAEKLINEPNTSTRWGIRDKAMLEVMYSTGVRLMELVNLTIFDIDLQTGFLRVNQGKGRKDRFVPLTKPACYWLKEYINKVRPRFTKNKPKEQSLFVGQSGKRINKQVVLHLVKKYASLARINKRVTVHTLRHTIATHLLDNNVDIVKIQQLLGHTKLSITQRYTKVSPKEIKQAHTKHHPREKMKDEGESSNDK